MLGKLEQLNKLLISASEAKDKTSQYKGVSFHKYTGKWQAVVSPKGEKKKYGGQFNDELDAAKRVNQLCEDLGIPQQNLEVGLNLNESYQVTQDSFLFHGTTVVRKSQNSFFLNPKICFKLKNLAIFARCKFQTVNLGAFEIVKKLVHFCM